MSAPTLPPPLFDHRPPAPAVDGISARKPGDQIKLTLQRGSSKLTHRDGRRATEPAAAGLTPACGSLTRAACPPTG